MLKQILIGCIASVLLTGCGQIKGVTPVTIQIAKEKKENLNVKAAPKAPVAGGYDSKGERWFKAIHIPSYE